MAGILAREAGDTQAVAEFDACMAMLPDLPDLSGILLGSCLYNKALALELMRGRRPEALSLYLKANAEFEATGMADYRRQALQNAAWVAVDLGNVSQAADLLEQAAPHCLTDAALWAQRAALARVQARQGAWTGAARLCQWILTDAATTAEVRCRAAAVAAETLLQQGNVVEARVMGQHAVTLALETMDNLCLSFASRVHTEAKQANTGAS
jgi:tetratricopeptide (TPR) repeat protein